MSIYEHEIGAPRERAGQPAIIDAKCRQAAAKVAKNADVPIDGLWLSASRDVLIDRISARPDGASDAAVEVLDNQLEQFPAPTDWRIIDASGSRWNVLDEMLQALDKSG